MQQAHQAGTPLMRPLCYDLLMTNMLGAYMFGPDILVAPVTSEGIRQRTVYLPGG